ncbi:MAG: hypothetical protein RJQ04_18150 [Longimicrobiales bacterium]
MLRAFLTAAGAAVMLLLGAVPGHAQLRPLDPFAWESLDVPGAEAWLGGAWLHGQRASLAGTEGRLLELGDLGVRWNLGRAAVEVSGTALWLYRDQDVFAPPAGGARPPDGRRRIDTGMYLVGTAVRLAGAPDGGSLALRFGTRLPTTSNEVGLGRDATDFYSTLAGRTVSGPWHLSAEVGLGVVGTRDPANEQVDPVLFGGGARYDAGSLALLLEFTGQHDTRAGREPRGTENLGEVRLGVRAGKRRWLRLEAMRGWTRMGPEFGVRFRLGQRF